MARIKDQEEQIRALKEIGSALKEISVTNKFLEATAGDDVVFTISFVDADGVKHSTKALVSNKQEADALALKYKAKIKSRIYEQAERYRIALDPEDQAILE